MNVVRYGLRELLLLLQSTMFFDRRFILFFRVRGSYAWDDDVLLFSYKLLRKNVNYLWDNFGDRNK